MIYGTNVQVDNGRVQNQDCYLTLLHTEKAFIENLPYFSFILKLKKGNGIRFAKRQWYFSNLPLSRILSFSRPIQFAVKLQYALSKNKKFSVYFLKDLMIIEVLYEIVNWRGSKIILLITQL